MSTRGLLNLLRIFFLFHVLFCFDFLFLFFVFYLLFCSFCVFFFFPNFFFPSPPLQADYSLSLFEARARLTITVEKIMDLPCFQQRVSSNIENNLCVNVFVFERNSMCVCVNILCTCVFACLLTTTPAAVLHRRPRQT